MKALKVSRPYWSFAEVKEHYKVSDLDLRRAIMGGQLRPCMWFQRGDMIAVEVIGGQPAVNPQHRESVRGWLYPVQAFGTQVDNFEITYAVFSDSHELDEKAKLWALEEPVTLTGLLVLAVVFDEDVRAAVRAQTQDPERDLSVREERTQERMLVTMAMELYGWDPASDRSTGVTELVNACKANGLPVSYNTAKKHLERAWQRCTPKLSALGDAVTPYEAREDQPSTAVN